MMKFRLLVFLAFDARESVDAAAHHARRLRTQVYPEEELAEDALSSVFDVFEIDMSMPSPNPSSAPSKPPVAISTAAPTAAPTNKATGAPTEVGSSSPTTILTVAPSRSPTKGPTERPTEKPSARPSMVQSQPPTAVPTLPPTPAPTRKLSTGPSDAPSQGPSLLPSFEPSTTPSSAPTLACNLSESARAGLISIFVRAISSASDVDTPGSPQNLAADWLINQDPLYMCPQDPNLNQRYTMAVFYYSTRGDRWTRCSAPTDLQDQEAIDAANADCTIMAPGGNSSAWLTPSSECTWGGLACDDEDSVVRIDFEQNGVAGTLPFELKELDSLRFLLLEEGVLTGTIPSQLGEIGSLEQIDLNFNLLNGGIPEEIYSLTNLRQLDLNDNELEGTISTSIASLSRLSFFQIENNQFTGMVPTELGALRQLEVATMDNNFLSGTMPVEVCANVSGTLEVLTVDCQGGPNRPSPPYVGCVCCTGCF